MTTIDEIKRYLKQPEDTGALLVTGQWGCGKSYLIKEKLSQDEYIKNNICIVLISLFGIDSVSMLNRRIKESYIEASGGWFTKSVAKLSKSFGKSAKIVADTVSNIPEPITAGIGKGMSGVLSIDMHDFVHLKREVNKGKQKRKLVLVFDDLERCKINIVDLLGAINEYVENKKIKSILVADETKIIDDKEDVNRKKLYQEFKEKVVSKTIEINQDYEEIIDNIIDGFKCNNQDYKKFLKDSAQIIKIVFRESEFNNIRTIKNIMVDFERIFEVWTAENIPSEQICNVLYTFAATTFEVKSNNLGSEKESVYKFVREHKQLEKYRQKRVYFTSIQSIHDWVLTGKWDEERIIAELKDAYETKELTDKQQFYNRRFFDLDFTTLQNGYKLALQDAYEGNCHCNSFIYIMQFDEMMAENQINIEPKIDFVKLEKGLDKQIEKIRRDGATTEWNHLFIESTELNRLKELDELKYSIYEKMQYAASCITLWDNRKKIINALTNDENVNFYEIRHFSTLERFDDELMQNIIKKYQNSDNYHKNEIIDLFEMLEVLGVLSLIKLKQSNKDITMQNLEKLKNEIEQLTKKEKDVITIHNNEKFISKVNEKIEICKNIVIQ